MFKKKRFQRDNWMGRRQGKRQKREQRLFALTIVFALVMMAVAFGASRSKTSWHLPFTHSNTAP